MIVIFPSFHAGVMMHIAAVLVALALAACDTPPSTIAEVVRKSDKVQSRAELERVLGKPHRLTRTGPAETWTYKATDGEISFLVVGDNVRR
ncbi:MAG: hypothetical protein FJX55_17515 [Alphaproteobacteria bacterium]|nr:hypothetical protein [Alphaproteobacteria bacterium]